MKNILNYSTTEEFQDHEVETGKTGMVRISKLGVVNLLSGTSDKGIIWKNIEDISNFHGDGWYETTGLEYPFLTLGNKYNVNLTPVERLYYYSSYPDTEKFEILEEPHYAAELSGTTYYGNANSSWNLNVHLERVAPTGNHPGEIEVKGGIGTKQLYYIQAAEAEQRVTSIVPGVAYIRETEEVKYNEIQFPAIDIGSYNTGDYTWEDFGITDEKFGYWKSLMTSGHPLPETFNVFLNGGVPNEVWEHGSFDNILFGFGDNDISLKVYSDGRCEIPYVVIIK